MPKFVKYILTAVLVSVALVPPVGAKPLLIVTDIAPVAAIVRAISSDAAKVVQLVPPNLSAHDFTLKPSDIANLRSADLLVWIGAGATPGLAKLMRRNDLATKAITLNTLAGTRLLALRKAGLFDSASAQTRAATDPHTWLAPENGIYWAGVISRALSRLAPEKQALFASRRDTLIAKIRSVQENIRQTLSVGRLRQFVQFHDAYQYFETAFGLEALGAATTGAQEETSLGITAHLQGALAKTAESCVFVPDGPRAGQARPLSGVAGATTAILDPLGRRIPKGEYSYPAFLAGIGDAFATCLTAQ